MKKKIGNFGRPSWRRFDIKNRVFQGSKRLSKLTLILKSFWHRFWDDFRKPRNVKNEQKRGRVALFLTFGVCKIRCRFGPVLEGYGAGFGKVFERFWAISGLFFPCLRAHGFGMFFLTLAGRLLKPKVPFLPCLSLFRFGPKFASQLPSYPHSYVCSF